MIDIKQGFVLGFIFGMAATVTLVWLLKHKLAKYYAGRYGTKFAEAAEIGIEEFTEKFLPGIEVKIGLPDPEKYKIPSFDFRTGGFI